MKKKGEEERQALFRQALQGKKIPVLTLDNKWYRLLTEENRAEVSDLEGQLNETAGKAECGDKGH